MISTRPIITEEALDKSRQDFIASVQALDRRIVEEPLIVLRRVEV